MTDTYRTDTVMNMNNTTRPTSLRRDTFVRVSDFYNYDPYVCEDEADDLYPEVPESAYDFRIVKEAN